MRKKMRKIKKNKKVKVKLIVNERGGKLYKSKI
jgi:hypothetical protein